MFELAGKIYKAAADYFCSAIYFMITGTYDYGVMGADGAVDGAIFIGDLMRIGGHMTTSSQFGSVITTLIKNGTVALQGFGIAVALLFSFIGIIELAAGNRLTPELLIKHFAKFGATFAAIIISDDLCFLIGNLGNGMINGVEKLFSGNALATLAIKTMGEGGVKGVGDAVKLHLYNTLVYSIKGKAGIGDAISLFVSGSILMIPVLALQIGNVAVFFIALSRGLELAVRALFMPIPIAFLSDDGWKGAGGRYLKKYAAVATQGMVVVAIAKCVQIFTSSIGTEFALALKGFITNLPCYTDKADKAMKDLGINSADWANIASVEAAVVPFGFIESIFASVSSVNNEVSLSQVLLALRPGTLKLSFLCVAVAFAGVGLMAKSLQICNDIWGV